MRKSSFFVFTVIAVAAPLLAQALKVGNTNAPVDVDADRIEVQDRADRAIFSGNVRVRQEGLALNAQRLTVAYNKVNGGSPQIDRLEAQGGVSVTRDADSAHGDVAIYDLNRRIITMIGGVELQQGGNTVHGGRLVIDLVSGRSVIDGSGVASGTGGSGAGSGGRVSGHFTVPQRSQ
jgi:lipopolysaccharide export system protein LptA